MPRKKAAGAFRSEDPVDFPTQKLLDWFGRNRRPLPWRDQPTPYSVWVSEVMLQQTVVSAVIEHYRRWMDRYSTIEKLAAAEIYEVTRMWEGLGYYSRARNLHKAARLVVAEYNGRVPDDYDLLRKLPGIGDYTASAILSIAYNKPYSALDANVRRVTQRLLLLREWNKRSEFRARALLTDQLPLSRPGAFNEALMELGQLICRRVQPVCSECPLVLACRARVGGVQEQIPSRQARSIRKLATTLLVCVRKDDVLIERSNGTLFRGLWLFPKSPQAAAAEIAHSRMVSSLRERTHFYTRYANRLLPIIIDADDEQYVKMISSANRKWVPISSLDSYPMPSVYRKISLDLCAWNEKRA